MPGKFIKDYFSFSKKERTAVLVLVTLLVIILLLPRFFPEPDVVENKSQLENFRIKIDRTLAANNRQNPTVDNEEIVTAPRDTGSDYKMKPSNIEMLPPKTALFYFDPNKLSSEGWQKLGIRDKTIATIHNYLSKGGRFTAKEDIQRIYGLRKDEVMRLMPYVRIEKIDYGPTEENNKALSYKSQQLQTYARVGPRNTFHMVDINQADTAELIALPGIGSKLATRIIHFREKLGGFYSIDQLSEIYGLSDSTFQRIRPTITTGHLKLVLININTAGNNELKQHPYIKWNLAEAIVAFRKQHGNYETLDDLRNIDIIDDEVYKKIAPYLTIE